MGLIRYPFNYDVNYLEHCFQGQMLNFLNISLKQKVSFFTQFFMPKLYNTCMQSFVRNCFKLMKIWDRKLCNFFHKEIYFKGVFRRIIRMRAAYIITID